MPRLNPAVLSSLASQEQLQTVLYAPSNDQQPVQQQTATLFGYLGLAHYQLLQAAALDTIMIPDAAKDLHTVVMTLYKGHCRSRQSNANVKSYIPEVKSNVGA